MALQKWLTVNDFNQILDNYAGRTIPHISVSTSPSNITGEETLIESAPVNIKCYILKQNQNWNYKESGFLEKGDAVALTKIADTVKVNDIIIIHNEKFRVKESYDVPGEFDSSGISTYVYTFCNLFLIE